MPELVTFKSGKDQETTAACVESVKCVACGNTTTDDRAYEEGWQIDPVVCRDCLRWSLTAEGESCCCGGSS